MNLDDARAFTEDITETETIEALTEKTKAFLEKIGFEYFACVSHVDLEDMPREAVGLHTYPQAWVDHFVRSHLEKIDPVQRYVRLTPLPFYWSDPDFLATLSRDQKQILEDARAYGLVDGYTVPLHPPDHVSASFSVCPGRLTPVTGAHQIVQVIAPYVFQRARRIAQAQPEPPRDKARLTRRQLECLELAALGKSDWVIGEILSLSERTVHHHLEEAKKRLGVATRAQAVVEALSDAQISMADIRKKHDR